MHFGSALRLLRVDAGVGLRDLARQLGVSTAYLSRVEHGHDPAPTPDRVAAIARALGVPPLVLLELAQGAGAALAGYLERVPAAAALFLDLARRDVGSAELARIRAFIDREIAPRPVGPVRLGDLLAPERVVLQLVCDDLDDLVEIAATRLATAAPRALADRILARERDAPSLLGSGIAVPHAIIPGAAPAAALITLRSPLALATPDGAPVRVAVVSVAPEAGRRHLELLAHVARLAGRGLAGALSEIRTPAQALTCLDALDVC